MTQYLLSVWHDKDATPEDIYPDPAEREQSYADTGAFNEEIRASGHWVFAGGGHPRRAVQRVQVADRRLLGGLGGLPRRGAGPRRARVEGLPRQGRGPSLPGLSDP